LAPAMQGQNTGIELASADEIAKQPTTFGSSAPAGETSPEPEQPGSESPTVGGESTAASKAVGAETSQASPASNDQNNQQAVGQPSPSEKSAVEQAPAKVLVSGSGITGTQFAASRRTWLVGGLLLAGIVLLAWVIVPVVRRHAFNVPRHLRLEPPPGPAAATAAAIKPRVVPSQTSSVQGNGFVGGPRQISVQLTASAPFSRSGLHAIVRSGGAFHRAIEPHNSDSPDSRYRRDVPAAGGIRTVTDLKATLAAPREESGALPLAAEVAATSTTEPVADAMTEPPALEQAIPQVPAYGMESSTVEAVDEVQRDPPTGIRGQSASSQVATPATMPETTHTPLAPIIKAPVPPVAGPQPPPGTMHPTVEVTFCFEVASVQLTPAFKVGALQVRPASKAVTIRLTPLQDSQPVTDSEVVFEVANVGLIGDALGKIQVVRSQQQKPLAAGSPSFAIAGLQFVPGLRAAPIWLTPSQQGPASVKVRAAFQISAIQFSPSFEVASVILNPSSKRVRVQLPGVNSNTAEGAPVFEIANVQLTEGGDIRMMQLNLLG